MLQTVEPPLTPEVLQEAGANGFHAWEFLVPGISVLQTEIVSRYSLNASEEEYSRGELLSRLLLIRGFSGHFVAADSKGYTWTEISSRRAFRDTPSSPAQRFGGGIKTHALQYYQPKNSTTMVRADDVAWAQSRLPTISQLHTKSPQFRLAVDVASDWRFVLNPRAAMAQLWSGIEALFDVNAELVYRISLLAACLLSQRGGERLSKLAEVRKLYGLRSKAVHGEELSPIALFKAVDESFELLRSLLLVIIDRGCMLSRSDMDELVTS